MRLHRTPSAQTSTATTDFLAALSSDTARRFVRACVPRSWRPGDRMLRSGQVATSAFLLQRGTLRVSVPREDGTECLLSWNPPGTIVGVSSLLTQRPLHVDIVVCGSAETLSIGREAFLDIMRDDSEALMMVARMMTDRMVDVIQILSQQTAGTISSRLLETIERFAQQQRPQWKPRDEAVTLQVSQAELATALGVSRQSINAELRRLAQGGRIQLGYRHITICPSESD